MNNDALYAAICAVSCGNTIGTGYLIRADRVLTARHCVLAAIQSNSGITLDFSRLPTNGEDIRCVGTIVVESSELDACILAIDTIATRIPLPITDKLPREGLSWKTFGFPASKGLLGHHMTGSVEHILPTLTSKIDLDLSVDPNVALDCYKGLSGAPIVVGQKCVGMLRIRADRAVGGVSISALSELLINHGIPIAHDEAQEPERPRLAERNEFQSQLESSLITGGGRCFFLEGAHGVGKTTFCESFTPIDPRLLHLGTYCVSESGTVSNVLLRSQVEVFYEWLVAVVSVQLYGSVARYERKTYTDMSRDVADLLDKLGQSLAQHDRTGVLIVDGINEVHSADPQLLQYFVGLLPRRLPSNIVVILSGPSYTAVATVLSTLVSADCIQTLPALTQAACIDFCSNELIESRASDYDFICRLCERSSGHPLYLAYLIRYANAFSDVPLEEFPLLDGPIETYYEQVWQRIIADDNVVHLLSLMARLRESLSFSDFVTILSPEEHAVFVPTVTRLKHLLLTAEHTSLYHVSCRDFITHKTTHLDRIHHARLATFCVTSQISYAIRNKVFHALNGDPKQVSDAHLLCTQEWVDQCVLDSIQPDVLLFDIEAVIATVFRSGHSVAAIRLLLLLQRVSFRYDTLFAQSALIVGEAFIALGRPHEALTHLIRHGTLIVGYDEALRAAYLFIKHKCFSEAITVLEMIARRCIIFYSSSSISLDDFLRVSAAHIRSMLLMRLADGESHVGEVELILKQAKRVLEDNIADVEMRGTFMRNLSMIPSGYFLTFCDTYVPNKVIETQYTIEPGVRLNMIAEIALFHVQMAEEYELPITRFSTSALLGDVDALIKSKAAVEDRFIPYVADTLMRLGASGSLVEAIATNEKRDEPRQIKIRAANGTMDPKNWTRK